MNFYNVIYGTTPYSLVRWSDDDDDDGVQLCEVEIKWLHPFYIFPLRIVKLLRQHLSQAEGERKVQQWT